MIKLADNKKALRITDARTLNPRSLRLEFNNGAVRLFDSHRLRGPRYIPLMNEEYFTHPVIKEGDLGWEGLEITCDAEYIYNRSVPYDDNAEAMEYAPTRRDIIGERIAMILFPAMALAGIIGLIWWYLYF